MTRPTVPDESRILEAEQRIRPYLGETPLLHVPDLDAALGHSLGLKCENLQRTGSFKVRGALNWLLTASDDGTEPFRPSPQAGPDPGARCPRPLGSTTGGCDPGRGCARHPLDPSCRPLAGFPPVKSTCRRHQ